MPPILAQASEQAACGEDPGAVCSLVFDVTESERWAKLADWLLAKPFTVLVILVVAVVLNRLAQRGIRRFIQSMELSPIQRGIGSALGDSPGASLLVPGPVNARARQRAETIGLVMRSVTKAAIWVIAGFMILAEFGVNLGPLIAGAGIVGVALGFGAQSLVRDFLSGMFMLVEDQFGVGDIIDFGEAVGVVEGVSLRTTRIRDLQGTMWHVPNGEIHRVGNMSQQWSRALIDVDVAYATDLVQAIRVIKEAADSVWQDEAWGQKVLEEPEVWGVERFGPDGIAIRLVMKTRPADQWSVQRELRRRMKEAFDRAGIEIPFPQRTVWMRTAPEEPPTGDGSG